MFTSWLFAWGVRWRIICATWATLGLHRESVGRSVGMPLLATFLPMLFKLDGLFFPAIHTLRVERPVFIIGHPRSGTTFLHRVLADSGEFVVFRLWELALPSLLGRRLLGPLLPKDRCVFPADVGHEVRLDSVEEEELLFLHLANSQFLSVLTPLAFSDWDFAPLVYCDEQPAAVQRRAAAFLRGCYQRQMLATGRRRVLSKLNYSAMRLRSLLEEFPDARVVYLVRNPLETIPSHLTLHLRMFQHLWGEQRLRGPRVSRYFARRYRYDVEFYRHMENLIDAGVIPPEQLLVVSHRRLREDADGTAREVAEFAGVALDPAALGAAVREPRPTHRNLSLKDFGLSSDRVRRDMQFVFEKYGFDSTGIQAGAVPGREA